MNIRWKCRLGMYFLKFWIIGVLREYAFLTSIWQFPSPLDSFYTFKGEVSLSFLNLHLHLSGLTTYEDKSLKIFKVIYLWSNEWALIFLFLLLSSFDFFYSFSYRRHWWPALDMLNYCLKRVYLILFPIDGTPKYSWKCTFLFLSFIILLHIHFNIRISATSILCMLLLDCSTIYSIRHG